MPRFDEDFLRALNKWQIQAMGQVDQIFVPSDQDLAEFATDPFADPSQFSPLVQLWQTALKNIHMLSATGGLDLNQPFAAVFFRPDDVSDDVLQQIGQSPREEGPAPEAAPPHEPEYTKTPRTASASRPRHARREPTDVAPAAEPTVVPVAESVVTPPRPRRTANTAPQSAASGLSVGRELDIESYEFSVFDDFEEPEHIRGADIRARRNDAGDIELTWAIPDADDGLFTVYRVVSEDGPLAKNPDDAEHRYVTTGTKWIDTDPITHAARIYHVWVYQGESQTDAIRQQPRFVGEAIYVLPVSSIKLNYDGDRISGQWDAAEGTTRVAVYIAANERRLIRPKFELNKDEPNLKGFIYEPKEKGVTYKVAAVRHFEFNDPTTQQRRQEKSMPSAEYELVVQGEVETPAISLHETVPGTFHASWNLPSSGQVHVYRTQSKPMDDVGNQVIEEARLESYGFPMSDRATYMKTAQDTDAEINWPNDWYSLFITPVHVVGEQCKVGETQAFVRVGSLDDVVLHERVETQHLAFAWPAEASEVAAYTVEQGTGHTFDPDNPNNSLHTTVPKDEYIRDGGMRLHIDAPVDIVLVPIRQYAGEKRKGQPYVVHYRGLERFAYWFSRPENGPLFAHVAVVGNRQHHGYLDFALVYNAKRLPLEPHDGIEVPVRKWQRNALTGQDFTRGISYEYLDASVSQEVAWEVGLEHIPNGGNQGHVRLFLRDPAAAGQPEQIVLDPDAKQLRIWNPRPPQQWNSQGGMG